MNSAEHGRLKPPLILVGDEARLPGVVEELKREGWTPRDGFSLRERAWTVRGLRLICVGTVSGPGDAAAALLAAARGAGVAATVKADRATEEHLFEDLSRIGPVTIRRESHDPHPQLTREQRELLTLLVGGASPDEAASALSYSRRTVERRLAEARAALGARTNTEALLRFRQSS
jgi:DNA-binding NarL/FixJ family response regulator